MSIGARLCGRDRTSLKLRGGGGIINTAMRIIRLALFVALAAVMVSAQATNGWKLVWSDEFNDPAGTSPDRTKWNYDLGGGGWGNGEAELYTNSANNVFQD